MSDATTIYSTLSEREHVLHRPDMYIGSIETVSEITGIPEISPVISLETTSEPSEKFSLTFDSVINNHSNAALQLIDEILQNSIDEVKRGKAKHIKVSIQKPEFIITVENDGPGIPIEPFPGSSTGSLVPTVLFSEFRSGSNFIDNGQRITAGKNGIGSKATNIFSQWFKIETFHVESGQVFKQTFRNNMSVIEPPIIKKSSAKKKNGYVKIQFLLDWKKLNNPNLEHLEAQIFARCFFAATLAQVTFQDLNIPEHGIETIARALAYKDFEIKKKKIEFPKKERIFVINEPDVSIAFGISEEPIRKNTLGFVNGLVCSKGTHLNHYINSLQKAIDLPISLKKCPYFFIVISVTIVEPKFTSQTKDTLATTKLPNIEFPENVVSFFKNNKVVKELVKENKEQENLKKLAAAQISSSKTLATSNYSTRRRVTIPKLTDAPLAGTSSTETTLILCEGDSAMGAIKSGLLKHQREYFGIFPLRGKIPNALKKDSSILKNHEIQSIVDALGLRFDNPSNLSGLRYKNGIILATDQDSDGHHICSLVYAFFWRYFKPLLELKPDFIKRMNTPLIKTQGPNLEFFLKEDYEIAAKTTRFSSVKYFKGLGTNTIQDMTGYFRNIDRYIKPLLYNRESSDTVIETLFGNNVEIRRNILLKRRENFNFNFPKDSVEQYMYQETGMYFLNDILRSIPNVIDGLKPSLRKIVFAVLQDQPSKESGYNRHGIKVSDFASIVSKYTMYHHGETSMQETVIGMSQCIIGVNNVPLLRGIGNFGTRETKPSDGHASPRYIYVNHFDFINAMFPKEEMSLLSRIEEDGQLAECEFFVPTIPFILVNGSDGIGTGWSSSILPRNVKDLIEIQKHIINSKSLDVDISFLPAPFYFSKFKGIYRSPTMTSLETVGKAIFKPDANEIHITELPIGVWTSDFIDILRQKFEIKKDDTGTNSSRFIVDIFDRSSAYNIDITIVCDVSKLDKEQDPLNLLNPYLVSKYNTGNCHALGVTDWIKNYTEIKDIFQAHGTQKLVILEKRLLKQRSILAQKIEKKSILLRFIQLVLSGELLIFKQDKSTVEKNLISKGFLEKDFEYLLNTSFYKCTLEKIRELESEIQELEKEKSILDSKTVWDIWMEDIFELEKAYDVFCKEIENDEKSVEDLGTLETRGPGTDSKSKSGIGKKRPRKS